MNRSDIRRVLEEKGVRPSRQLGQNFLTDESLARQIVDAIDTQPEDCVIEVGPGTGALTRHLVGRVRRLVLIEFDARLAEHLRDEMRDQEEVEVIFADGARFDLRPFYREGPVKFIGNLPYSAGGAILKNFFTRPTPVSIGVVMLQKEFIDRMLAEPGGKDYGVLSVRLQSEWEMTRLFDVPPDAFNPRPKIDSTVARLEPLTNDAFPPFDARLLDTLLRRGFGQRRKQLHKQIPEGARPWMELANQIGFSPTTRAEQLSVGQWIDLTRAMDPHPLMDVAQKHDELFDVVDENDQVIGRETRSNVHERQLRHRAIHILVWNKYGEVFLQKRSRLKDKHPGVWGSSASGHLDSGEDYDTCAVRELEEELGITGVVPRPIASLPASPVTEWEFVRLYQVEWTGNPKCPCAEVEAGLWIHPQDLEPWLQARHPGLHTWLPRMLDGCKENREFMNLTDIHNHEIEVTDTAQLETLLRETPTVDGFGAFQLYTKSGEPEIWLHFNGDIAYVHYFQTSDGSHPGWQPVGEARPEHLDLPDRIQFLQVGASIAERFEMPKATTISKKRAIIAAWQFFVNQKPPPIISWYEL